MSLGKVFCALALIASTAASATLTQSQLPGRGVTQSEAESLKGGDCTNAVSSKCGRMSECEGLANCVGSIGTGKNDPTCSACITDLCDLHAEPGKCAQ